MNSIDMFITVIPDIPVLTVAQDYGWVCNCWITMQNEHVSYPKLVHQVALDCLGVDNS